jgi:hypothetical protein
MKLLHKTEVFVGITKCQDEWEAIDQKYLNVPILFAPKWDMEFHVHTNTSNLIVGAMLAQNPTGKCDRSIAYASKLLNNVEKNYTTTKRKTFAMVYVLHNSNILY